MSYIVRAAETLTSCGNKNVWWVVKCKSGHKDVFSEIFWGIMLVVV